MTHPKQWTGDTTESGLMVARASDALSGEQKAQKFGRPGLLRRPLFKVLDLPDGRKVRIKVSTSGVVTEHEWLTGTQDAVVRPETMDRTQLLRETGVHAKLAKVAEQAGSATVRVRLLEDSDNGEE